MQKMAMSESRDKGCSSKRKKGSRNIFDLEMEAHAIQGEVRPAVTKNKHLWVWLCRWSNVGWALSSWGECAVWGTGMREEPASLDRVYGDHSIGGFEQYGMMQRIEQQSRILRGKWILGRRGETGMVWNAVPEIPTMSWKSARLAETVLRCWEGRWRPSAIDVIQLKWLLGIINCCN